MESFFRYVSTAMWPLILVSACSNVEAVLPDSGEVPLTVARSTISGTAQSRGTAVALTEGSIGVFLTSANGYTPKYDIQYEYRTDKWVPAVAEKLILLRDQAAKVSAYYPYGKITDAANATVTLEAQVYDKDKEFFYAVSGGDNICISTPTAIFNLKHAYARLQLSIGRAAGGYTGTGAISAINLRSGSAFYQEQILDIFTGKLTGNPVSGGWKLAYNATIAAGTTDTGYDVLLPPQPLNDGLTITLTIDNKSREVTIPASKFSGNLVQGNLYTIKLMISDTGISITGSVTVTDFPSAGNTNVDASWD